MRFFLKEFQTGGCDYTIGCGTRVTEIEADTLEEAVEKASQEITTEGEGKIYSAVVFAVSEVHEINVQALADQRRAQKQEAAKIAKQEQERAEYERLKAKFQT